MQIVAEQIGDGVEREAIKSDYCQHREHSAGYITLIVNSF